MVFLYLLAKCANLFGHYLDITCGFVSTNSITQGEQVSPLWTELLRDGIFINFAYRTFQWNNEADIQAHVHCVIIGFCYNGKNSSPMIWDSENQKRKVTNINPYLLDAPSVVIRNRAKSICNVPQMIYGSMPIDNNHLILNAEDVKNLLKENPDNQKFIRDYVGGAELINNQKRWCLWLGGISPSELKKSPFILDRVRKTETFRKNSKRPQTLALANTPTLFGEIRQPSSTILVVPKVSSENRRYIPLCYVDPSIIVNGSALILPDATLYHFGILTSNVHMAWMRAVGGRLKSDYQYSNTIVYNNFPWPENITDKVKEGIEKTAQGILDARAKYPDCSLADLYDEVAMPPELRTAHQKNDEAVMKAYGFPLSMTESECVGELMKMYKNLVDAEEKRKAEERAKKKSKRKNTKA